MKRAIISIVTAGALLAVPATTGFAQPQPSLAPGIFTSGHAPGPVINPDGSTTPAAPNPPTVTFEDRSVGALTGTYPPTSESPNGFANWSAVGTVWAVALDSSSYDGTKVLQLTTGNVGHIVIVPDHYNLRSIDIINTTALGGASFPVTINCDLATTGQLSIAPGRHTIQTNFGDPCQDLSINNSQTLQFDNLVFQDTN